MDTSGRQRMPADGPSHVRLSNNGGRPHRALASGRRSQYLVDQWSRSARYLRS